MRISKLQVKNFRCFDSVDVDFHSSFNVFVGNNATGKTALLDAITIILSNCISMPRGFAIRDVRPKDVRKVSRWSRNGFLSKLQYPVEIRMEGTRSYDDFGLSRTFRESDISSITEKSVDFGHISLLDSIVPESNNSEDSEEMIFPILISYGTDRLSVEQPEQQQMKTFLDQADLSRMDGYRNAFSGGHISPQAMVLWLEYQDWIAYKQRHESSLYIAVREAMTAMIPQARETQYDPKTGGLILTFEDGSAHPFYELSEGQRCMAALAGDIAIRMSRLNPQLDESVLTQTPGVVLIDELDLHLHPQWQREVAARLRKTFPLVQFITTTHSPQILSEVEPDCIRVLDRSERGYITITKPVQSYGLDANSVLENLMGADARPQLVQERIDAVDDALEAGEWDQARALVSNLRQILHGDDPEVARLDASTSTLEALADAVD